MRRFGILRILEFFDACSTKFKYNQIIFNKIYRGFQMTTKLCIEQKILLE